MTHLIARLERLKTFLFGKQKINSELEYWENRVREYGKRSVLNIGHPVDEYDAVTEMQKREIYPHFLASLTGDERVLLDFGCGPGRFTRDLANLIKGTAVGVDPIVSLLEMAPEAENVTYTHMEEGLIPLPDESVDIVWICLVLGANQDNVLNKTCAEISRVLKQGGLLFLVENTDEKKEAGRWRFRQFEDYKKILTFVQMAHLADYFDVGERISIMAGRKSV